MERKRYSAEFKREAVKLASQPGMVKRQVAEELGIHENLLRSWIRQFAAGKWEAAPGKQDYRKRLATSLGVRSCACRPSIGA